MNYGNVNKIMKVKKSERKKSKKGKIRVEIKDEQKKK